MLLLKGCLDIDRADEVQFVVMVMVRRRMMGGYTENIEKIVI